MNMTSKYFDQINTTAKPGRSGSVIKSLNTVSIVVFSLVSVLGVLGNGVVIWVTGFKMKKTVNTVWYLNLAVADFLYAAFLPLTVTSLGLGSHWPFGNFMWKLNTTVTFQNMFVSGYILMMISVDRCVSVVWPVWAQNHRNVRKASCVSLAVWVVALILKALYFFFMETKQKSEDKIKCFNTLSAFETRSQNQFRLHAIVITNLLLGFAVPFTAIVSCYTVIIHRLRKNRGLISQSRRPFKMIAAIIITFFFCWAPYQILHLRFRAASSKVFKIGIILSKNLAALNSCMNPLLYVFIRQDFKDLLRKSILNVLETAFREEETHSPTQHQAEKIEL